MQRAFSWTFKVFSVVHSDVESVSSALSRAPAMRASFWIYASCFSVAFRFLFTTCAALSFLWATRANTVTSPWDLWRTEHSWFTTRFKRGSAVIAIPANRVVKGVFLFWWPKTSAQRWVPLPMECVNYDRFCNGRVGYIRQNSLTTANGHSAWLLWHNIFPTAFFSRGSRTSFHKGPPVWRR